MHIYVRKSSSVLQSIPLLSVFVCIQLIYLSSSKVPYLHAYPTSEFLPVGRINCTSPTIATEAHTCSHESQSRHSANRSSSQFETGIALPKREARRSREIRPRQPRQPQGQTKRNGNRAC